MGPDAKSTKNEKVSWRWSVREVTRSVLLNLGKPSMTANSYRALGPPGPGATRGPPRARAATPQGHVGRGGDAHAQPGLQAAVLLRHPEAAPVLQRDEGLVGEARSELPEEAALEVGQHAVHVYQHPESAAPRPARRPAPPRRPRGPGRAAGPPRAPAAQPDHGPCRALAAGTGDMTAGGDTVRRGRGMRRMHTRQGARGMRDCAQGGVRAGVQGCAGPGARGMRGARGARGARARRLRPQSEAAAFLSLKGHAPAEAGRRGGAWRTALGPGISARPFSQDPGPGLALPRRARPVCLRGFYWALTESAAWTKPCRPETYILKGETDKKHKNLQKRPNSLRQ